MNMFVNQFTDIFNEPYLMRDLYKYYKEITEKTQTHIEYIEKRIGVSSKRIRITENNEEVIGEIYQYIDDFFPKYKTSRLYEASDIIYISVNVNVLNGECQLKKMGLYVLITV